MSQNDYIFYIPLHLEDLALSKVFRSQRPVQRLPFRFQWRRKGRVGWILFLIEYSCGEWNPAALSDSCPPTVSIIQEEVIVPTLAAVSHR